MTGNRLYRKFIINFLGFILFPFIIILTYLLIHSNKLQLENDRAANEYIASQTISSVSQQIKLTENLCKSVLQNEMLISFFDKEFESSLDLSYYTTTIRDFVKVTNGVSDIKLRIYLENETIPMGFSIFYPFRYLDHISVIKRFYEDDDKLTIWLDGNYEYSGDLRFRPNPIDSYSFLHKIRSGSRTIGIMSSTVPKHVFHTSVPNTNEVTYPIESNGFYLYNYTNTTLNPNQIEDILNSTKTFNYSNEFIYTKHYVEDSPFNIAIITNRSQLNHVSLIIIGFTVLFFLILAGLFISYSHHMIKDIHACLDGLEIAITDGFKTDAGTNYIKSISQDRNDEIALLAQRIEFLLEQIHSLLWQTVKQQTAAKHAQLLTLQHQINPHFLYNTMEIFSARMELNGLYEESAAISAFCRMLRYNINTKELMVTLEEELTQVKNYLTIQKIRNIPFELTSDIPSELLTQPTIRFLLEPFVENSFKYRGLANPLCIHISAQVNENNIKIIIQDNGEGLPIERLNELNARFKDASGTLETSGHKVGLSNINSRLKLFYGEDHYIHATSHNLGTCFSFTIDKNKKLM